MQMSELSALGPERCCLTARIASSWSLMTTWYATEEFLEVWSKQIWANFVFLNALAFPIFHVKGTRRGELPLRCLRYGPLHQGLGCGNCQ